MIDSHCHLTDPRLREQLDDVFARAKAAGVERMITIGTNLADDRFAIDLCNAHPDRLRCAIGVHPNYCQESSLEDVAELRAMQAQPCVVALGEMGLDYFHQFSDRQTQTTFFEAQLQLADEFRRPVVIHCREAVDDTLAVLKNFPRVPALVHCFTGTSVEAARIVDAGYFLGFTGAVTFKRSDDLREAAKRTPRDRLVVETDSPYLSPEPLRSQKTNEPALVVHVADIIATCWGVDRATVDRVTTQNVASFFGW